MKIKNGKIRILVDRDKITLQIDDYTSKTRIAEIKMNPAEFAEALSRSLSSCDIEIFENSDKYNKIHQAKGFTFRMPAGVRVGVESIKDLAYTRACQLCPVGWTPDKYFGSRDSFFYKGDILWAKVTIRRWIDIGEDL